MSQNCTLVIIKPDGLKKSLTGNILTKLSEAKLIIVGAKVVKPSKELAESHYQHLSDKPFFGEIVNYIQGKIYGAPHDRVIAFVYMGEDAINKVRKIVGATNPEEAEPTSIRGAYGRILTTGIFENVIHASSDPKEAEREIKLWFQPGELVADLYATKASATNGHKVWA